MKKQKTLAVLKHVEIAGAAVPLLDVSRLIASSIDHEQLAQLTVLYSNGRSLQPFRTGFEQEQQ
jgi:hypothetical protein